MRSLLLFFLSLSFSIVAFSQKIVLEGKISDGKTNSPVPSVTIKVINENIMKAAGVDGQFSLVLEVGKKYSLEITAIGYQSKIVEDVIVENGKPNVLDITITPSSKTEEQVVVRSSARKETTASLIALQKNTSVVAQVISAEAIRRSPDKNTGEVLRRVPGASVQDGKYLVIRGLADRYNQAMLNGILLSSTEPDRKTFSFDIFPSAIIDNIIINKAFIPELPGEWAGGIVQVNTKDVPAKNFLSVQVGTGFNTQTLGKDFYTYKGSNTDFLGYDNGERALAAGIPNRSTFTNYDRAQKTALASSFSNNWSAVKNNDASVLNTSLQINGGITKQLGTKNKLSGVFAVNYNRSNRNLSYDNSIYSVQNNIASSNFDYHNNKYARDILAGALANISLQLGKDNKISFKNILNVNTTNYATLRTGKEYDGNIVNGVDIGTNIRATELAFKANTFFNTQLSGDHNINPVKAKLHWYGSFNILDQYVPDQRRIQYNQDDSQDPNSPYSLLIGPSQTSQKTGSRYFGSLSDYIYTGGGDISKTINIKGVPQTIKAGYFFQVKDRIFDSRPFAYYLAVDNPALRHLDQAVVFSPENFGNGADNKFGFNEISGNRFRYVANSIMNAGFLQFDDQLLKKFRVVWGLRIENFDQVVGSYKQSDDRFIHTQKTDFLPGVNITYKLNSKTNLRLAGSQTVVRPEFRELSTFSFYDFDLGATVTGEPKLVRTKISNLDLRYELYPRAGELFTLGVFYKQFMNPIELFANPASGGASTFNYINADDARSYGAEFEFRKKLDMVSNLKNFTVQGNVSYIYNRIPSLKRPMQGQSPYLLNFGLQYDVEKAGLTTTLLFNQIGRRIYYVGNQTFNSGSAANDNLPPVWEAPRPVLDFQVAKKVIKGKGELKLNASDIFNQQAKFYHDLNDNKKYDKATDVIALSRKYGTTISLSFSYNIK